MVPGKSVILRWTCWRLRWISRVSIRFCSCLRTSWSSIIFWIQNFADLWLRQVLIWVLCFKPAFYVSPGSLRILLYICSNGFICSNGLMLKLWPCLALWNNRRILLESVTARTKRDHWVLGLPKHRWYTVHSHIWRRLHSLNSLVS